MTMDKPFECVICGESFRWEISLDIHTKTHVDGEQLYGVRKQPASAGEEAKKRKSQASSRIKSLAANTVKTHEEVCKT